jgi:hypothetical protein
MKQPGLSWFGVRSFNGWWKSRNGVRDSMTTVTMEGRSARELLDWGQRTIEVPLRAAVLGLPAVSRTVVGYHFGWWDRRGRPRERRAGQGVAADIAVAVRPGDGWAAGGAGTRRGQIFVRGKVVRTVPEHQIVDTLLGQALALTDRATIP